MRLILLRHGPAVERSTWTGPDHLRPLTDEGAKRTRQVLRRARPLLTIKRILASPWVRAETTGRIASEILELPLEIAPWLVGDGRAPESLLLDLPVSDVLLVGHEPDLGALAGLLLGSPPLHLKKAGFAILDGDPAPGGMTLRTLLGPTAVLALGA